MHAQGGRDRARAIGRRTKVSVAKNETVAIQVHKNCMQNQLAGAQWLELEYLMC